jgi:Fe-S cluster assembly ATP-binding protein
VPMLEVKNLHVAVDGKQILKGLDLAVNKGEVHAIMGPNGSGKSTLAYVMTASRVTRRPRDKSCSTARM